MALFRRGDEVWVPGRSTTIGRGPACHWRVDDPRASRQHARVEHANGEVWDLRDLGSRCGTWLNGQRIRPARSYKLSVGDSLRFGRADGAAWRLVDDGPPQPLALEVASGRVVYADAAGLCRLSRFGAVRLRGDRWFGPRDEPLGDRLTHDGREWRLLVPSADDASNTQPDGSASSESVQLELKVSPDQEELREVWLRAESRAVALEPRVHTSLLFVLARARVHDSRDGEPDAETGWVDVDDLPRKARIAEARLSLYNLRLKKQLKQGLEQLGCREAAILIAERVIRVADRDVWQRRLSRCDVLIVHD